MTTFNQSPSPIERSNAEEDALVERCLRGEQLYGDDFSPSQIEAWFRDEEDGYFNLGGARQGRHEYEYRGLNQEHGFRFLPARDFANVLSFGGAFGDELLPIVGRSKQITILEASDGFVVDQVGGVPVRYVKSQAHGGFPFADKSFDLLTCLSVLHHVPNVSFIVKEFYRCLKPGGYALVNEPIVSMGDWRHPRQGLTKRERGIPRAIFNRIIVSAGFEIVHESKCMFSLTSRLRYLQAKPVYNAKYSVILDKFLCRLPFWPETYHPANLWEKMRPTAIFYVLRKSAC